MEIALDPGMPTYSGGLGVLAGDTLKSGADLRVPMVAVSLLHRKGYFSQRIDEQGRQREEPEEWNVDDHVRELPQRVVVLIEGRPVQVRAWEYVVRGVGGFRVPVYLLDTDLPENSESDRALTHFLYGGDEKYRLCQEAILGIGGHRMLRALGHSEIERFHMNEGHAGLLTIALLEERLAQKRRARVKEEDIDSVRESCVFTTHTPVPAAFDKFPRDLAASVLSPKILRILEPFLWENTLNMTYLALNLSHYVNGVAKKHGETSRLMFADYQIDAITNGVHAASWVSKPFQSLFDRYVPGWREDNQSLRYALSIPTEEVWQAHKEAKGALLDHIARIRNVSLDPETFTIGFARRAATYKRADLVFHDIERLKAISEKAGSIQFIYAGKAHPADEPGKDVIHKVIRAGRKLHPSIPLVYLHNYGMELGGLITAGVDLWLNTPLPPMEASGTSGMKAALNGVPSLSTLDGWWVEGCIEGKTGWAISDQAEVPDRTAVDAASLYGKLEHVILPLYYNDRGEFTQIMRRAIAINGSFFNTQRMLQQYVLRAYFR
jgi:starch phosphorylase